MKKKIYWSGVEYSYTIESENPENLKGGFVYAFVQAFDAREALEKLMKDIGQKKITLTEVEFISPYDRNMKWEDKKQTKHYNDLYSEAKKTKEVIFDDFYAYQSE